MKKRKHKLMACFLLIAVSGFILFDYFGPRMIIQVRGGLYSVLRPQKKRSIPTPEDFGLQAEKISVKTSDNLTLAAYLIKSNTRVQKGTVIMLHGIRSYKEHFLARTKQLADSSFNSVLVDLRGHGGSEGKYCTYGFSEKFDISVLVDTLRNRAELNENIGVWGQSLGGAIALQSLAINPKIKFGIIESTFSDFDTIVHDYFTYHLGFDIPFVTNYLINRTQKITCFDPEDVKPYQYAKSIKQPVIIVHGKLDKRIAIKYGRTNFENLASCQKDFIEIPKANHLNVWRVGGKEYFKRVFRFLNEQEVEAVKYTETDENVQTVN